MRIERWDDPVDNLKSHRIYWLPEGTDEAESVAEVWGHLDPGLVPTLKPSAVLTLRLGDHCFERRRPKYPSSEARSPIYWRKCQQ